MLKILHSFTALGHETFFKTQREISHMTNILTMTQVSKNLGHCIMRFKEFDWLVAMVYEPLLFIQNIPRF